MRLRLESKLAKIATITVVATLLAPYSFLAWSRYNAARIAEREDRESLERAVQLQPGDASYQERLGRYLLFVEQDAQAALQHYQMAADINPYSARNWLGVAQAQLILGNSDAALNAIDHALDVDPHTPSVAWESGNLLITLGQTQRAMEEFRFTMANDPTMVGQGLQLVRRMESPSQAAKTALPPDPGIFITFINMLLQSKDIKGAQQVWTELIALHKPFDPKLSYFYISSLMASGELDAATHAWSDLEQISPDLARRHIGDNFIRNASFEYRVLNGGFDWLFSDTSQLSLQSDVSESHEGQRSIMVTFDGSRPSEIFLRQYLVLASDSHFRFSGYIKGNLQTANGLRFVIIDTTTGKRMMQTDEVIGGRRWIVLSGDFQTEHEAHLYLLSVERSGTTLVRGNAWIDDLKLVKEPR